MELLEEGEVKALVERLTTLTGETKSAALHNALKERLDRLVADDREAYIARIRAVTSRVAAMPVLDNRDADDIIGYNEHGLFD